MKSNRIIQIGLLLLTTIFINTRLHAQSESSLGAFLAFPVGDFKSTDLENGGFAEQGWGIVFDSKTPINTRWALNSHSTYQWNNMNTEKIGEALTNEIGFDTEISESRYSPLVTTLGLIYSLPIGEKVKISPSGNAGVMFNNTKAFTIKIYDVSNNLLANEVVNFDNRVAFAYNFGVDLRFELIENLLALSLYGDYTGAKQKTEISIPSISSFDSFQKLQYMNFGVKLAVTRQN